MSAGVPVLIYSGDQDYICNWRGGEAWTNALVYPQQEQFNKMNYATFEVDGNGAGEYKSAGLLTFLRVYSAGHLVPMD